MSEIPVNGSIDEDFTILIVDNDVTNTFLLEGFFQRESYQTFSLASGRAAISFAREKHPDIILLDFNLPDVNGPDVCKNLKSDPITSEIPVFIVSKDCSVNTKILCFEAGAQDYITKPFERREVLARVRTHLKLVQTQRSMIRLLSARIRDISAAQQNLLPLGPSDIPFARFAVHYQQLAGAGGDFYDVETAGKDVYDYITADVSGHDAGIAFTTAALKALLVQNCTVVHTPSEIINIVNKVIPAVLQNGQYVGISWVRVNRRLGKATVVNGGQPSVVYIPIGGCPGTIDVSGDIVGIFENVAYEEREISVSPGDRFLLYSDGIIEIDGASPENRENGVASLLAHCKKAAGMELDPFIASIVTGLTEGRSVGDDIIVLGVEV